MPHRVADPFETASMLQDQENLAARCRADALEKARLAEAERVQTTCCTTCGEDLPAERLKDKRIRCTPCQQEFETKRGGFPRTCR